MERHVFHDPHAICLSRGVRFAPRLAAMSIRDWPEQSVPREKLLAHGPGQLTDAELLAVLFGSGSRGVSAVDLGGRLLREFGCLRGLLCADRERCRVTPGLGARRYGLMQAALELPVAICGRRPRPGRHSSRLPPPVISSSPSSGTGPTKCSAACSSTTGTGSWPSTNCSAAPSTAPASIPARWSRQALHRNAAAVILAHNHPSGVAEPSQADELITLRLRDALALVDIRVLDHLIVGDTRCVSLAERGGDLGRVRTSMHTKPCPDRLPAGIKLALFGQPLSGITHVPRLRSDGQAARGR